jgi:uncharacterized membrane protein
MTRQIADSTARRRAPRLESRRDMWWYNLLKTVHILAAIIAIGANLNYGVWAARGQRDPQHQSFALRGIKLIDDRIANPAYAVLLLTGLVMWLTTWPLGTRWILSGIFLYVLVAALAITVISPALSRQIKLVDAGRGTSDEANAAAARLRGVGIFVSVVVIAIVFLMVFKPSF